jgi:hypothetical protein
MSGYPILVERYDAKHPADMAICVGCKRERKMDPADGDPYDMCLTCRVCGDGIMWKYNEADKCPGCGTLGFWDHDVLKGACSRKCMLQAEYAASLKARA